MKLNQFIKLFESVMPDDMKIVELIGKIKESNCDCDDLKSLEEIIDGYGKLNWQAYISNHYESFDNQNGPIYEFLKNGLFEGKKLFSHAIGYNITAKQWLNSPKVSVVIVNYNNGIYLNKCIKSVLNQSLSDIEIIIGDDCSEDKSWQIIESYLKKDERIKAFRFDKNRSQHMIKKMGVKMAVGQYIMFLDSDDFYDVNACKIAYENVSKGYDIVYFNSNIVNRFNMDDRLVDNVRKWVNANKDGEYGKFDLINAFFNETNLNYTIWNKIYATDICKKAFEEMADGAFYLGEDFYEFMHIVTEARKLKKIPDKLYYYCFGGGITSYIDKKNFQKKIIRRGNLYKHIERYVMKNNYGLYKENIKNKFFIGSIFDKLEKIDTDNINAYFNGLINDFGSDYVLNYLIKIYQFKWSEIACKIQEYKIERNKDIKHIGIFYYRLSPGGIETTIKNLCRVFKENGYKITLFIEEKSDYDMSLDDAINVCYVHPSKYNMEDIKKHIIDMNRALDESKIDLLFYMYINTPMLLWITCLMHFKNIPIIASLRTDFNFDLLTKGGWYSRQSYIDSMKCVDKVFCLSKFSQLYLRANGVDAEYIVNPILEMGLPDENCKQNKIVVIARLGEQSKRVKECLRILSEVVKVVKDATMVFVGDFKNNAERMAFYKYAQSLNVYDKIEVSGWVENSGQYIKDCKLLLSTSYIEGFGNGIAEALSMGLPCVLYKLQTMLAVDNRGVISVDQFDYKGAAAEIIKILKDDEYRKKLQEYVLQDNKEFNFQNFSDEILNLVYNFDRLSNMVYFEYWYYSSALNSVRFYANKGIPKN